MPSWTISQSMSPMTYLSEGGGNAAPGYPALPEAMAPTFAALGDPTRLRLVAALSDGMAHSILELTRVADMSRQGVTKHLLVLANAGVVSDVKVGRERLWQLEGARIDEARLQLDAIAREWEGALSRLKSFVEKDD